MQVEIDADLLRTTLLHFRFEHAHRFQTASGRPHIQKWRHHRSKHMNGVAVCGICSLIEELERLLP